MASIDNDTNQMPNVTGAVIFVGYVLAALLLTTLIVVNLYRAYLSRPSWSSKEPSRVSNQFQVFVALAVLSFSTLSYHMLNYLIYSFRAWAEPEGLAILPGLHISKGLLSSSNLGFTAHLWQWLTESVLFYDFAKTICQNSANFWWTLQALLVSMASALFISIEGKKRDPRHE
ncbi:MAG: hypothetical protein Q9225_001087 [Loekoesia sp. 1 TL-2023]